MRGAPRLRARAHLVSVAARKGGVARPQAAERLRAAVSAGGGELIAAGGGGDAVDGWRDADRGLGSGPREIDSLERLELGVEVPRSR